MTTYFMYDTRDGIFTGLYERMTSQQAQERNNELRRLNSPFRHIQASCDSCDSRIGVELVDGTAYCAACRHDYGHPDYEPPVPFCDRKPVYPNCPACEGLGHQNGCEICNNSGVALPCNLHYAHGMGGDHYCTRVKGHEGPHRDS